MDKRTDGRTDGRTNGGTDEWMDGHSSVVAKIFLWLGLAGGYGGLGGVSAGRDGASGGLAGVFGRWARVGFGPRLGPLDAIPEGSEGLTGIYEGLWRSGWAAGGLFMCFLLLRDLL